MRFGAGCSRMAAGALTVASEVSLVGYFYPPFGKTTFFKSSHVSDVHSIPVAAPDPFEKLSESNGRIHRGHPLAQELASVMNSCLCRKALGACTGLVYECSLIDRNSKSIRSSHRMLFAVSEKLGN